MEIHQYRDSSFGAGFVHELAQIIERSSGIGVTIGLRASRRCAQTG